MTQTDITTNLLKAKCEACRDDSLPVSDSEMIILLKQIPNWSIIDVNCIKQLTKEFSTKDFKKALLLTQKIGELAEKEDHHPEITTKWGKVTVRWWTHKIHGLHRNDFIMAAKTDEIAQKI